MFFVQFRNLNIFFQLLITHHQVYELIGSRWMDQGTAFCFGQFQEETNEALLIARSERNYHDIVLSTAIRSNDVYQRQQGKQLSAISLHTPHEYALFFFGLFFWSQPLIRSP